MQTDMHYYGTYALARMAGFAVEEARVIAYSAQFVDDSTEQDSEPHADGGLLYGIATAHTNAQVMKNNLIKKLQQRRVWTPFHFLPGGEGDTFEQKLLCVKDSKIANQMLANHINHAKDSSYGLHLMGIACHVYADTFSHYGFSGIGSKQNRVHDPKPLDVKDPGMADYLISRHSAFINKYASESLTLKLKKWFSKLASAVGEEFSGSLGHGAVGTYPDRPYLKWQFTYELTGKTEIRDNPATFLEGCEKLHQQLVAFGKARNPEHKANTEFSAVKDKIEQILRSELPKKKMGKYPKGRIDLWKDAVINNELFQSEKNEALQYDPQDWENQKQSFHTKASSEQGIKLDVYKFHQAATYHRYFVLKDLLPRNGIAVF